MARMHDGITVPLGPSPIGLGIGLALIAVGVAGGLVLTWFLGAPLIGVGLLFVWNGAMGSTRIRITHSKLLVEHDRPVRSFLIGPSKERVAWSAWEGAEVTEGGLVVKGPEGLTLGNGAPADELSHLNELAVAAATRWKEEQEDLQDL